MTQEYEKFVKWKQSNPEKNSTPDGYTRTQYLFVKKLLNDQELVKMLSQPGDLQIVMKQIQQYLKS